MIQSTTKSAYCRDCFKRIPPESEYCPNCGQKNFNGKIRVRTLFKEFLSDVFGLESRLVQSIIPMLFQPGRLTQEYFRGRHKSFISPLRSFGLMTILMIAGLLAVGIQADLGIAKQRDKTLERDAQDSMYVNMVRHMDTLSNSINDLAVNNAFDSLQSKLLKTGFKHKRRSSKNSGTIHLAGIKLDRHDLQHLQEEEIYEKYKIDSYFGKRMIRQGKKFVEKGDNFLVFVVKNSSWTIFFLIPIFAFILHLLHRNRKHYYVEHLIFGLHFHTAAFFIMLLMMLSYNFVPPIFIKAAMVYLGLYLLFAMKRYYQRSWMKTIIKFLAVVFLYNIIAIFALAITALIGFVLY